MKKIFALNAGIMNYARGLELQNRIFQLIKMRSDENNMIGVLILLQHYPVYTVGIRSKDYTTNLEDKLKNLGAEFFKTNRGGLITFHGPGQLIVYPILNLKHFNPSVRWYISQLENTVILLCEKNFNIKANISPHTGVWVKDKKLCAIGIHISQYVTTHGIGLNCNTNLKWFSHIIPCGIEGKGVTSLTEQSNRLVTVSEVVPYFLNAFRETFNCRINLLEDETGLMRQMELVNEHDDASS